MRAGKRQAFTLLELLVVVAIIGILAALLFPAIQTARENAKGAKCLAHIKQIALAMHAYASEFGGHLPKTAPAARNHPSDWVWGGNVVAHPQQVEAVTRILLEDGVLWSYVDSSNKGHVRKPDKWYISAETNVYLCPSAGPVERKRGLSYSMNWMLDKNESGETMSEGVLLSRIRNTARCVLLVDEGPELNDGYFDSSDFPNIGNLHSGGGNLAFCDGHVKWFPVAEIQKMRDKRYFVWWE